MGVADKKEALRVMKRKGTSLAVKFALLIMILMVMVVLMVSLPLGYYMIDAQERTLARGLQEKVQVLLESLVSGARTYLPLENTLEIGLLPAQIEAMEEAQYATITGSATVQPGEYDAVWATNDPDINIRLKDATEVRIRESVLMDRVSPMVDRMEREINEAARSAVAGLSRELEQLSREALQYVTKTDRASVQTLNEIQETIRILDTRVNRELKNIGDRIGSEPQFDTGNIDPMVTDYVFYKPIIYRRGGEDVYYRGLVRLGVSTVSIIEEINAARNRLISITGIVAVIAMVLGILGSLLLAAITVNPIRKLVAGVEHIRDTVDHSDLRGFRIPIRTRDEISTLAETINEMTEGLITAADKNKELLLGKDIQKMFIPLNKDASGRKLTTGGEENENGEFFGYYEGADEVSGDYFDYMKLDGEHYAVIKCDVSGHGVSAALIMIEVATIFLYYFKDWTLKSHGTKLEPLVYRINDLLEERGFTGKFAALSVLIVNIRSGEYHFCHAGDNKLHTYDGRTRTMVEHEFPEAPAAGMFPSDLVQLKSGYRQHKRVLGVGDILLLFTDGIEESNRNCRDSQFRQITADMLGGEAEVKKDPEMEIEDGNVIQQFTLQRVRDIVNAVFQRGTYRLQKKYNPIADEEFVFDFSQCGNTAEDVVMALMAVEKVFRINPDPSAGERDRILVDRKIDAFLRKSFRQYRAYFHHPVENTNFPEYVTYTHLREDKQDDDLTLLAIRKK